MAIGDKPADLPQWADGGSAQITEPSAGKKALGWVKEKPAFAFFNWFWNLAYQWIAWAKKFGEEHVHDGGSTDWSAPKVDLENHVDYGAEGYLTVTVDTGSEHRIRHEATGSSVNEADLVVAATYRVGLGSDYVSLEDASGLAGARQLQVAGSTDTGVRAEALFLTRSNAPGGDFTALFPEDRTLYLKNLTKVASAHNFTESVGTINNAARSTYNTSASWTATGAPAGTYILGISDDTEVDGVVQAHVALNNAGADTGEYKACVDYDSGNSRLELRLYKFSGGAWVNVRTSAPTGLDVIVSVTVF